MNKETKNRIKAYKNALPHMKERVMAVAMLLVISVTMMTSATFAWVTLSRSPEVSGLATTIATNGNLEIALSDIDGLEPEESNVGDGGKGVRLSNLTWGNLINLSDPSYGLEAVTLRPAALNPGDLDVSPLYSMGYGADGRIEDTVSGFLFTNYETRDGVSAFYVPADGTTDYGVRAISSVTYNVEGEKALVDQLNDAVTNTFMDARTSFQNLYNNRGYMNAVTKLAGVYLDYRMDDTDQPCQEYIEALYNMVESLHTTMEAVKTNLLAVANLQYFMYCQRDTTATYMEFTEAQLLDGTVGRILAAIGADTETTEDDIIIDALDDYLTMRTKFYGDGTTGAYSKIRATYEEWDRIGDFVGWEELAGKYSVGGPLNVIADIPSTTVNGTAAGAINKDTLGSLIGYDPNICVIQKGLIVDMDKLLGTQLSAHVDSIQAMGMPVKNIEVSTAAKSPWTLADDNAAAHEAASGNLVAKNASAADTYGMAVDFWVRTNIADSLLVLEGEFVEETVVLTDAAGNPILDDEGKPVTEKRVVGYQGVNRVWEEGDPGLPDASQGTSATQGSGSCYVFYPDGLEDQAQSLKMLQAMCVAFVDEDGELLAIADMLTDKAFEDAGRVLVPLQARGKTVVTGQTPKLDNDGNEVVVDGEVVMEDVMGVSHHITTLTQNEAKRITAILYLDGSKLTNSEVLSAGSINGQLNIQFGTTENLVSMNDPDLKDDFYNIELSVERISNDASFSSYDPDNKPTVELTLVLDGMQASAIKGNFVSMVSATQGAKQDPFVFTREGEGLVWKARVTLNGAGTYQLRSIQIDGVDYALSAAQIEDTEIYIPGTTVNEVTCVGWNGSNKFSYMSADSYYTLTMQAEVSGTTPSTVQGVFVHEDGQNVTMNFTYDSGNLWEATGNFITSGKYKMEYMIIDGAYVGLPGAQYKTLELSLGLRTRVFVSQPVNAEYLEMEELYEAVDALNASNAQARAVTALTDEQKLLAAELVADSTLSADEKSALTGAVNINSFTEAQKTSLLTVIDAAMDALLEVLHSDADNCLDLKALTGNKSGYEFFFSGSEDLFMDVSCIITDDKGNVVEDLENVTLVYAVGSTGQTSRMEATLDTNYEGRLQLHKPGVYNFRELIVGENRIQKATAAPVIRAISPAETEYVGRYESSAGDAAAYRASYTNISSDADRYMTVVLKEALSGEVEFILAHWDTMEQYQQSGLTTYEDYQTAIDNKALTVYRVAADHYKDATVEGEQYSYFTINLADDAKDVTGKTIKELTGLASNDGVWRIVGMQAHTVFYDDPDDSSEEAVFYDGDSVSGTGWADMSQEVFSSDITTEFFTTVIYSVNTQPEPNKYANGVFMQDNIVSNMAVTLTDYLGNAIEGAAVELKYVWTAQTAPFTANSANLPNTSFAATMQQDGKTFAMPAQMNFQLAGEYVNTFKIEIDGKEYSLSDFTKAKDSIAFKAQPVTVSWKMPSIKITGVTPDTSETYEVNYGSDGAKDLYGGVKNYYEDEYACVYFPYVEGLFGAVNYSVPEVELTVSNVGNAASASVTAANSNESFKTTYSMNTDSQWAQSQEIGKTTNLGMTRNSAGTVEAGSVTLTYGNVNYTFDTNDVLIKEATYPYYLQLDTTLSKVILSNKVTVIDSKGNEHDFRIAGMDPVRIFTPDGRPFSVVLPNDTGTDLDIKEFVPAEGETESDYQQVPTDDPKYERPTYVYYRPNWYSKYNNYTRTLYYTTTRGVLNADILTYGIQWTLGNQPLELGATVTNISKNTAVTGVDKLISTQVSDTPQDAILYKYYLHDVSNGSAYSSNGGTDLGSASNVYNGYVATGVTRQEQLDE